MKNVTCCFTGHRKIPESKRKAIIGKLTATVSDLISEGYLYFGTGGALGFDTLAALTVLRLKKLHPRIRLILVLPCENQYKYWNVYDKKMYQKIKSAADKVVYISKQYDKECMKKRNRHLVDNSSVCVCYNVKSSGGTAYTVNYARKSNLRIINIA